MKTESGYIALVSILVISAIVVIITISTSLLSISESQIALAEKKKEETIDIVEACIEDALLTLNEDNALPESVSLPEGTCTVTTDSQSDNTWTFTVESTIDSYTKKIQVIAQRTNTISITRWNTVE